MRLITKALRFHPSKKNPPVVFLPGSGCDHRLWSNIEPFLPRSIITPFMFLPPSNATIKETVNLISEIPLEKFSLVGFSYGGYLAQQFLIEHPERISSVVLMNCVTQQHLLPSLVDKILSGEKDLLSNDYLSTFLGNDKREDIIILMREMLARIGEKNVRKQIQLTAERPSLLKDLNAIQQDYQIPCFAIGSDQDKLVSTTSITQLAESLAADYHIIPSVGHMTPLEDSATTGLLLNRWFTLRHCDEIHAQHVASNKHSDMLTPAGEKVGFLAKKDNPLDPYTKYFFDELEKNQCDYDLILEVGAGNGEPAKKLLSKGFRVIVNDLNPLNLKNIWDETPIEQRKNLYFFFGNILDYTETKISLSAIIANRVLHFLSGKEIDKFFTFAKKSLLPDAFLVITVASINMRLFKSLKNIYLQLKKSNALDPGWLNIAPHIPNSFRPHLPEKMQLFDVDGLINILPDDFSIVKAGDYTIKSDPHELRSSTLNEGSRIGIVAIKTKTG